VAILRHRASARRRPRGLFSAALGFFIPDLDRLLPIADNCASIFRADPANFGEFFRPPVSAWNEVAVTPFDRTPESKQ